MGGIFFSDYVTYVVKTASNRLFERMAKIAAGGGYLTHSIFWCSVPKILLRSRRSTDKIFAHGFLPRQRPSKSESGLNIVHQILKKSGYAQDGYLSRRISHQKLVEKLKENRHTYPNNHSSFTRAKQLVFEELRYVIMFSTRDSFTPCTHNAQFASVSSYHSSFSTYLFILVVPFY